MEESVRQRDEKVSKQINMQHTKTFRSCTPWQPWSGTLGRTGASRGYGAVQHSSTSPRQAHRTSLTLWQQTTADDDAGNKLQHPKRQGLQEGLQASKKKQYSLSYLQSHINVGMLCAPALLPLKHKTPPGLAALAGGENQPLGNRHEVLLLNATNYSQRSQSNQPKSLLMHRVTALWWCLLHQPWAPGPAGPGEVTLLRPQEQVLQCSHCWVEIHGLEALGDENQGHLVVLRQHSRYLG